eukprot:scaffold9851_cov100-Isochrysis_galbana.AAC.8
MHAPKRKVGAAPNATGARSTPSAADAARPVEQPHVGQPDHRVAQAGGRPVHRRRRVGIRLPDRGQQVCALPAAAARPRPAAPMAGEPDAGRLHPRPAGFGVRSAFRVPPARHHVALLLLPDALVLQRGCRADDAPGPDLPAGGGVGIGPVRGRGTGLAQGPRVLRLRQRALLLGHGPCPVDPLFCSAGVQRRRHSGRRPRGGSAGQAHLRPGAGVLVGRRVARGHPPHSKPHHSRALLHAERAADHSAGAGREVFFLLPPWFFCCPRVRYIHPSQHVK